MCECECMLHVRPFPFLFHVSFTMHAINDLQQLLGIRNHKVHEHGLAQLHACVPSF